MALSLQNSGKKTQTARCHYLLGKESRETRPVGLRKCQDLYVSVQQPRTKSERKRGLARSHKEEGNHGPAQSAAMPPPVSQAGVREKTVKEWMKALKGRRVGEHEGSQVFYRLPAQDSPRILALQSQRQSLEEPGGQSMVTPPAWTEETEME